jgi:DNA-binding beta-propeller fold protein YncE
VVTRRLRAPVRNAGVARFEPAAAAAATGRARNNRLGKIVGGRGLACGVGDVAANGAGVFVAFGRQGSANGQLSNPAFIVLDDEGNFVVSDSGNSRVQVFDSSNGTHLRTIGPQLAGVRQPGQQMLMLQLQQQQLQLQAQLQQQQQMPPHQQQFQQFQALQQQLQQQQQQQQLQQLQQQQQQQLQRQVQPLQRAGGYCFSSPQGIALDGSGHLVVADSGSSCVHVLNYADGSYVSTISNDYLGAPSGVAVDSDGNIVVHDGDSSGCIQIFRLSDGARIRSIGDQQCYGGGSVAFDVEGNLVVACQRGVLVLDYSNGSVLRMISSLNQLQEVDNFGGLPFIRAPCQQLQPYGFAMDSAGHLVVSDSGSHSLHVLNYADGSLVRTIGGYGTRNGQFYHPRGVAIDGDGRIIVCDMSSHRIQVLQVAYGFVVFVRKH